MSTVYMRQAKNKDLIHITAIIDDSRHFLKKQGLDQWQSGYPNQNTIVSDLQKERGYVLIVDNQVAGYVALLSGEDPVYTNITSGKWLNQSQEYIAIHRFAISNQYRGQKLAQRFMTAILTYFFQMGIVDFRIDTHPENIPMQAVIAGNGFSRRGNIYIDENNSRKLRWAYQLVLV